MDLHRFAEWIVPEARAAENGGVSAYPQSFAARPHASQSWFVYGLPAGTTKQDAVVVENTGDRPVSVRLYPVDATHTSDGAFALRNEDEPRKDVGSWIILSRASLRLGPGEKQEVPFAVRLPPGLPPGDYAGGIIVQNDELSRRSGEGMQVSILSRLGVRVYESVPGKTQVSLRVGALGYRWTDDRLIVSLPAKNLGTVRLEWKGTVEVRNMFSSAVARQTFEKELQPASSAVLLLPLPVNKPLFDRYTVEVQGNYEARGVTKPFSAEASFFAFRGGILLGIGLALLLVGAAIALKRRR